VVQPAGRRALEHLLRHDHQLVERRSQASSKAFGDPKALSPTPSWRVSEDVGGVKSDHVNGDIASAALVQGIAAVARTRQRHVASPISPAQVASSVQSCSST